MSPLDLMLRYVSVNPQVWTEGHLTANSGRAQPHSPNSLISVSTGASQANTERHQVEQKVAAQKKTSVQKKKKHQITQNYILFVCQPNFIFMT